MCQDKTRNLCKIYFSAIPDPKSGMADEGVLRLSNALGNECRGFRSPFHNKRELKFIP